MWNEPFWAANFWAANFWAGLGVGGSTYPEGAVRATFVRTGPETSLPYAGASDEGVPTRTGRHFVKGYSD